MHQHDQQWYDPLHIITWPYWFIDLDFTCSSPFFGPSTPSHHSTCPSHLQLVHRAKSCLDLLHLDHMTQCHVSYAVSSIITCVSYATYPSHLHHHGMSCSHKCTCGLITCVSHINTISPPRVITQLPKPIKDLLISPFLVIDDNSTKILKLSSFGFMLLAQAILPCVNDFGQVSQTQIGSISSPIYVLECLFGSSHICIDWNCGRVITTNDAKV